AADKVPVDHDRCVLPNAARIDQVIFDSRRTGHSHAAIDAGRYRYPASVANGGNQLAGFVEIADELQHVAIAPQLVGHETAGHHDAVEIRSSHAGDRGIGHARVAVFTCIFAFGLFAGDDDRRPGLDEPQLAIPQL